MHIGNSNDYVNYTLNGSDLTKVNQEKDLEIIISNDLKPEKHISEAVKAVNKLTGFIRRVFEYKSEKSHSHAFYHSCPSPLQVLRAVLVALLP